MHMIKDVINVPYKNSTILSVT